MAETKYKLITATVRKAIRQLKVCIGILHCNNLMSTGTVCKQWKNL